MTMKTISTFIIIVALLAILESTSSLSQSKVKITHTTATSTQTSRRAFLTTTTTITLLSSPFFIPQIRQNANALEQCRAKARNCIRTTWTAPSDIDIQQAIYVIKNILNSYPQNGQNGIDCNGWTIVRDSLSTPQDSSKNGSNMPISVALEYKSCVGPAALAINLAQPFIDDVIVEFDNTDDEGTGTALTVQVKSSSRMGSSDLFVNKKRIEYLGDKLRQQGWIVPDVKYGA